MREGVQQQVPGDRKASVEDGVAVRRVAARRFPERQQPRVALHTGSPSRDDLLAELEEDALSPLLDGGHPADGAPGEADHVVRLQLPAFGGTQPGEPQQRLHLTEAADLHDLVQPGRVWARHRGRTRPEVVILPLGGRP